MQHKLKKGLISILILANLIALLSGCSLRKETSMKDYAFYFDTIITIEIYGSSNRDILDHCFDIAKECDGLFSSQNPESDISRINEHAGEYVTCDSKTVSLLEKAVYYGNMSQGIFDVTLGRLSDLWNISEIAKNVNNDSNIVDKEFIPKSEDIQALLPGIDYRKIDIKEQQVMLKDNTCKIDVGGIAKGYVADLIKEYLQTQNITSACIDLGGNILTIGKKYDKDCFQIGIQKPFGQQNETIDILLVEDKSIVSSGIYERYFKVDDRIYHHILDCQTGYPVQNDLYMVTIISSSSADGDALSTISFLLGKEKGMEYIESLEDVEAIFVTKDYELLYSSGAKQYSRTQK